MVARQRRVELPDERGQRRIRVYAAGCLYAQLMRKVNGSGLNTSVYSLYFFLVNVRKRTTTTTTPTTALTTQTTSTRTTATQIFASEHMQNCYTHMQNNLAYVKRIAHMFACSKMEEKSLRHFGGSSDRMIRKIPVRKVAPGCGSSACQIFLFVCVSSLKVCWKTHRQRIHVKVCIIMGNIMGALIRWDTFETYYGVPNWLHVWMTHNDKKFVQTVFCEFSNFDKQ